MKSISLDKTIPHSFWTDKRGHFSVSLNQSRPGPVAGYLIPVENGWVIEGDECRKVFANRDEPAKILIERYSR